MSFLGSLFLDSLTLFVPFSNMKAWISVSVVNRRDNFTASMYCKVPFLQLFLWIAPVDPCEV